MPLPARILINMIIGYDFCLGVYRRSCCLGVYSGDNVVCHIEMVTFRFYSDKDNPCLGYTITHFGVKVKRDYIVFELVFQI